MSRAPLLLALAALAACSRPAPEEPDASALASSAAEAAAVASAETMPSGTPAVPTPTAAPLPATPEAPSESRDPAMVVVFWAKAMSLKQWGSAYLYWGDHGARSGMTAAQFAAKWGKLANPEFELHKGTGEGAAGSLFYYTAPIVLIDGKRHVAGEIVLRRVGDVDGASAEQLRWHIESLTITP